jgi:proteic killer suppression protein
MIRSFRHKGLKELFEKGATARIQKSLQERCLRRLDALDRTTRSEDMNVARLRFSRPAQQARALYGSR